MSAPMTVDRVGTGLKIAIWTAFVFMLVVTFTSAFLRLALSVAPEDAIEIARGIHRLAATLALLVVIAVAILGWDTLRPLKPSRIAAAALVVLAFALGALGIFTPSDHVAVILSNPVGGLAMVGCAWWLCLASLRLPRGGRSSAMPGWLLTGAAFAALVATVLWRPSIAAGLAGQFVATALLLAGVALLYRTADE